jgi:hypothetical protein
MFRIPWWRPRRDSGPVPTKLRHRRDWSRWGRWCSCGLRWRGCPDRSDSAIEERWRARLGTHERTELRQTPERTQPNQAPERTEVNQGSSATLSGDRSAAFAGGGARWAYPIREMVTGLPPRPPRVRPTNRGPAGAGTGRDGRTNLGPMDPGPAPIRADDSAKR